MSEPERRGSEPAVRHAVEDHEPVEDAVYRAVERAGVDVTGTDRVLFEAVDADALGRLLRSGGDVRVSLRLWGLYAVVEPDEVVVYRDPDGSG